MTQEEWYNRWRKRIISQEGVDWRLKHEARMDKITEGHKMQADNFRYQQRTVAMVQESFLLRLEERYKLAKALSDASIKKRATTVVERAKNNALAQCQALLQKYSIHEVCRTAETSKVECLREYVANVQAKYIANRENAKTRRSQSLL